MFFRFYLNYYYYIFLLAFWRHHGEKSGFPERLWSCLSLSTKSSNRRPTQKPAQNSDTLGPSSYCRQERRLEGCIRSTWLGRTFRDNNHQPSTIQQTWSSYSSFSGIENGDSDETLLEWSGAGFQFKIQTIAFWKFNSIYYKFLIYTWYFLRWKWTYAQYDNAQTINYF